MIASLLGIILANSGIAPVYFSFLETKVGPLSVLLWINDALMAFFFLYVGLEVKREMLHGQLNTNAKRFLPGIAAFFGLSVPAIIYVIFNQATPEYIRGWAIPTATDIAFALGVLALLGSRVPASLKIFLTALAIMDDLMAIVIIALFYSDSLNLMFLGGAGVLTVLLIFLNKQGYIRPISYIVPGVLLWLCVLLSGIHATLAGVVLALTIPFHGERENRHVSPLIEWEHALSKWVTFLIVPIFGFANAGVSFGSFTPQDLLHPVVLGIAVGLFLGKQVGVWGSVRILVALKIVPMPEGATWRQIYGVALLCGIGFTMSLFVSLLAFSDATVQDEAKIGIFLGSFLSGLLGYLLLRYGCPPRKELNAS